MSWNREGDMLLVCCRHYYMSMNTERGRCCLFLEQAVVHKHGGDLILEQGGVDAAGLFLVQAVEHKHRDGGDIVPYFFLRFLVQDNITGQKTTKPP